MAANGLRSAQSGWQGGGLRVEAARAAPRADGAFSHFHHTRPDLISTGVILPA